MPINVGGVSPKQNADGTIVVSGGGGGTQYTAATTAMGNSAVGNVIIGMQSGATTGRALLVTTTGSPIVTFEGTPAVTAANVTIASITTGSVSIKGGTVFYVPGAAIASGTGTGGLMFIGIQSGATTGRAVMLTTTGHQFIDTVRIVSTVSTLLGTVAISGSMSVINTPTVTASQGGTWNIATVSTLLGTIAISGTCTALPSGTQNVAVVNTPTVTIGGTASAILIAGTARAANVGIIAHQSQVQGYVVATTSAAGGVIVITSGAHTLYITDVIVSVEGPMTVDLCSATTKKATVYLATNGGFVSNYINPLVLTTAQSFVVVCGSSGKCAVSAVGYTVT